MPNLLNEAVADGTVVPRCFLGEYHSQLNAWDVWNFGFTKKCEGNGENDQWASCTACETEKVKASEGAVIGGTVFKSGLPCNISYLDCVGGHPPCKQRPQTVCAALPNTVRRAWSKTGSLLLSNLAIGSPSSRRWVHGCWSTRRCPAGIRRPPRAIAAPSARTARRYGAGLANGWKSAPNTGGFGRQ